MRKIDFKKISPRERILLVAFITVMALGFYFQSIYKPLSRQIAVFKVQVEKSKSRLNELKAKFPQIEKQKQAMRSLKAESQNLFSQIDKIEKNIPPKNTVSQLLSELIGRAKGLKLVSVRQKVEEDKERSRIFIELKFNASYKEVINYIRKIESISPFLVIEELDISPAKTKEDTPVKVILSSLLGEVTTAGAIRTETDKVGIEIKRDIFISKAKPVSALKDIDLKLEGITYNPTNPTAIVNNEVIKANSTIGRFTVKEIRPNEIILTDGIEEHILSIEK